MAGSADKLPDGNTRHQKVADGRDAQEGGKHKIETCELLPITSEGGSRRSPPAIEAFLAFPDT